MTELGISGRPLATHSSQATPLHYDPYINLFRLACGSPTTASKHFLILPPTMSPSLKRAGHEGHLRNTSPVEFELQGAQLDQGQVEGVRLSPDSPGQGAVRDIAKEAYHVTLRPGELLLLPERWWHRVENVGDRRGWTAGVGYWFLTRQRQR